MFRVQGWIRLIAAIVVNICMGTIYSWSIFRTPLEEIFQIDPGISGLPYMIFLAAFAFSMPLGGKLIDKIGPRKITMISAVLLGAAWLTAGYSRSFALIVVSYGALGGAAVGLSYGAPLAIAGRWFPEKRGLYMGIALFGFGLSPFVTAPLAEYIILHHGVTWAFRIMGIGFFAVMMLLGQLFTYPADSNDAATEHREQRSPRHINTHRMLRSKSFYALWTLYVAGTFSGLMVIGITAPAAMQLGGFTRGQASILVSLLALCNGIGRPIFGVITDKIGPSRSIILASVLGAAASAAMLILPVGSKVLFIAIFALFWLLLGGWLAIAPAATTILFGTRYYSSNYGVMYTAYGVGAILGNLLSGQLFHFFGSYRPSFIPTLVLFLFSIVGAQYYLSRQRIIHLTQ